MLRGSTAGVLIYFAAASTGVAYILLSQGYAFHWNSKLGDSSQLRHEDTLLFIKSLLHSELAVFIIVNWVFAATSVLLLLTTALFLGRLSARESTLLMDRLIKYCAFKILFINAMRLPSSLDQAAEWIAWFAVAGFMRIFIGMARDRLEALMAAPGAPLTAHLRAVSLVLLILTRDVMAVRDLWGAADTSVASLLGLGGVHEIAAALSGGKEAAAAGTDLGTSRLVLCAYDLAIIMLEGIKILIKYGVHVADLLATRRALAHMQAAEHLRDGDDPGYGGPLPAVSGVGTDVLYAPWGGKGGLLYHVELFADVAMHSMTIMHYLHMWWLHGCALHVVDMVLLMDVRAVSASLYRRLKLYCEYRTATYRLHHAFPDAWPREEVVCSICMEPMQVAKQLPCGHVFHLSCLRAWLQQSGAHTFTCPNCRQPLLVEPPAPERPPGVFDLARRFINRQIALSTFHLARLLLELDRSLMQRHLQRQQQHLRGRRGRGGRGWATAADEPEGSGESSHPAPVSRFTKLLRKLRGRRWQALLRGLPGGSLLSRLIMTPAPGSGARHQGLHPVGRQIGPAAGARDAYEEEEDEDDDNDEVESSDEDLDGPISQLIEHGSGSDEFDEGEEEEEGDGAASPGAQGMNDSDGMHAAHYSSPAPSQQLTGQGQAGPGSSSWYPRSTRFGPRERPDEAVAAAGPSRAAHRPLRYPCGHSSLQVSSQPTDPPLHRPPGRRSSRAAAGLQQPSSSAGWHAGQGPLQGAPHAPPEIGPPPRRRLSRRDRSRQSVRALGGPSVEMPTWSGEVLQRVARGVTHSVRSSLGHVDSRGAIAGGCTAQGEEVVSRRQHPSLSPHHD